MEFNREGTYPNMIAQTKRIIELFLTTDWSLSTLGTQVGLYPSTIKSRLNSKDLILKVYPENGMDIYNRIQQKLNPQREIPRKKGILRLDLFSKDTNKQIIWLMHLCLTFRVKPITMAPLVGLTEAQLMDIFLDTKEMMTYDGMIKLINNDYTDQEIAKSYLLAYYREYLTALRNNDLRRMQELLRQVNDKDALLLIKNRRPGEKLSDKDIKTILRYQLKYYLDNGSVSQVFDINKRNYQKRLKRIWEENPDLQERYEYLTEYAQSFYWKKHESGGGSGRI